MNLPMFAIILEDHPLAKIYGASRVVHLVNSKLTDTEQHITTSMSGREINAIYKALDYTDQMILVELDIYNESEVAIIVDQIELLNNASDSEGRLSESLRELVVMFLATLLFLTSAAVTAGYYENSRQNDAVIESRLFSFIGSIVDKFKTE